MVQNTDNHQLWRQYAAIFIEQAEECKRSGSEIEICLQYAEPLFFAGLPVIFSFDHFCQLVGYTHRYVAGAANATAKYYRYFDIPKRSGGLRHIAEPLPSLKAIQTWILRNILDLLNPHFGAKAYIKGKSIRDNARFHRSQRYVLTIDIIDFFPSIQKNAVYTIFANLGYSQQVASIIADLCCLGGNLPQGAPTSPAISNLVCFDLDERLFNLARSLELRYTRYADDLTFSGVNVSQSFILNVYGILSAFGFEPNLRKTRVMKHDQRQEVTGIIVNQKLQASRELRLDIRKQAYYIRKFGIESHALYIGESRKNFDKHLVGRANFVRFVNSQDPNAQRMIDSMKKTDE